MNKTVNINLANILFHIDEDAFDKMQKYLESVKRSLADTPGSDEILADIEARIAELFTEKLENERQVITHKEVDEVIAIMGQPEDYMVDEDIFEDEPKNNTAPNQATKKLYRDTDQKFVAGVSSGLSYYLGIDDPIWVRILWVLLTVGSGGGFIFIYGLLWILIPEAATTSQKLDMRGEDVNISNIEKKVKEGFNEVADKVKNVDYQKVGNQVKNSGKTFFDTVGDIIMFLFKVFGKLIGVLLIIIGASMVIGLFIALLTVGIAGAVHIPGVDFYQIMDASNMPVWIVSLLGFFAVGIPFFFLLYLGLKILVTNLKSIGNIAKFSLLGLWLISVIMLIVFGVRQAAAHAYDDSVTEKHRLFVEDNKAPINIVMVSKDDRSRNNMHINGMKLTYNEDGKEVLTSRNLRVRIKKSQDSVIRLDIRKDADGPSFEQARKTAKNIDYSYNIEGNTIYLDDYLSTDKNNGFHDQEAYISLYLPTGTLLNYTNGNLRCWKLQSKNDRGADGCKIEGFTWKMGLDGKLQCQECPEKKLDKDENHGKNSFRINGNGININMNEDGEKGKIIINEDGIDINVNDNNESVKIKLDENGLRVNTNDN